MNVNDEDTVRVIRVLEYVGKRSWVEGTLSKNTVQGIKVFPYGTIREASVGPFPEVITEETV